MNTRTHLRRATLVGIGAAVIALVTIGMGLPASASAPTTTASTATTASPPSTYCTVETEKKVIDGAQDQYRQRVDCANIPSGVNAGFYAGWEVWTAPSSTEGPATTIWGDWGPYTGLRTLPEYRVDPKLQGTVCTAEIITTIERTLKYDEHAAKLTCSAINPLIQVRARGNYNLQADTLSGWITTPGTAQTPGQTRTSGGIMPTAEVEYSLR